jgi:predicted enzyme related to lactoylglutathione lyase
LAFHRTVRVHIFIIATEEKTMDSKFRLHGAFSWCELLTGDVAGAKDFYSRLFNWTLEPAPGPNAHYTLVKYGGEQMGGIMAIPPGAEGMRPAWGVYVTVDDVDTTAKLAVELGAKVCVPPCDIPEVGRFCVLQDPQGAMINVITYLKRDA